MPITKKTKEIFTISLSDDESIAIGLVGEPNVIYYVPLKYRSEFHVGDKLEITLNNRGETLKIKNISTGFDCD